jgi:branched-chain amino acid transport system permease protein
VLLLKNVLQDTLPLLTQRAGQLQAVAFAVLFILLLQHARGGLMGFVRRWTRGRFAAPEVDTASLAGAEPLPRRALPARAKRSLP